ncbi:MAG: JAB domain-containing protein [Paludibacteraceae bacterium]|nr:JAB domain-containing protein [Paludibacteraceae bacterium]
MKKISKKTKIHNALWVIECPECGAYLASASERDLLPQFSICCKCSNKESEKMTKKSVEFSLTSKQSDMEVAVVNSSKSAYDYVKKFYFADIDIYESVFILLLNQSSKTVGFAKISQGGVCSTTVDVKIVCKYVVDSLCTGAIIVHNHPSGGTEPSKEDDCLTEKLCNALKLLDSKLLDHIIISSSGYYSYADNGKLLF